MVVLMVMLAAGVIIERASAPCWQSAISTYYYTSAHSIVIAALLALGTLFIIYRGSSDTEDVLLTLAGVAALTAAIVPQKRPQPPDVLCPGPANLPTDYDALLRAAVLPNVWAVAIALGLGYAVIWSVMINRWLRDRHCPHKRGCVAKVSLYVFWLTMAVGLLALIFFPDKFLEYAHGAAAVLLIAAFIATTFCTAYVVRKEDPSKSPHQRCYKRIYCGIAWLMLVTAIVLGTVVLVQQHCPGLRPVNLLHQRWLRVRWGLVAEVVLIGEFAAYWVVQTIDLWKTPDRSLRLRGGRPPGSL